MSAATGGAGLFAALKALLASVLAIGRTRAELLASELEEEKFRLIGLLLKAVAALFLLGLSAVMLVCWLAVLFWEQRVWLFGGLTVFFLFGAGLLLQALRQAAERPSSLFRQSLAELDADLARLRASPGEPPARHS